MSPAGMIPVCPVSYTHLDVYKRQALHAERTGLQKDSIVLLEQVRTIDKHRLKEKMGKLDDDAMRQVNEAIGISFGPVSYTHLGACRDTWETGSSCFHSYHHHLSSKVVLHFSIPYVCAKDKHYFRMKNCRRRETRDVYKRQHRESLRPIRRRRFCPRTNWVRIMA